MGLVDDRVAELWGGSTEDSVYAVIDAARDDSILPVIQASGLDAECLYDGALTHSLAAAAPWLISLVPEAWFTRALLEDDGAHDLGILLASPRPPPEVRRDLRRSLTVRDEAGQPLYFRYYDPRVLAAYLPTCTAAERALVFGCITSFWTWRPGGGLVHWSSPCVQAVPRGELIIRRAQLAELAGLSDTAFVDDMVAHVRRCFPQQTCELDVGALRAHVERALQDARSYDLVRQQDLCRFVNLTLLFGLGWELSEPRRWMHEFMVSPGVDPSKRLSQLQRRCLYRLEAEDLHRQS